MSLVPGKKSKSSKGLSSSSGYKSNNAGAGSANQIKKPKKKKVPSKGSFSDFFADNLKNKKDNYNQSMYDSSKQKKSKVKKSSNAGSGSAGSGYSGYSSGSSSGSGGGRSSGVGGKKGGGGAGGSAYARRRAATMVRADTNSQVLAMLNEARGKKAARDYDISAANALYNRTSGDLSYLFNEARDFNTSQTAKIDERFGTTTQDMNDLYSNFTQQENTQVDARKAAAMQELQRLGIQQSGTGNFDADAQNSGARAAQSQSDALANLLAMHEGSSDVGNLLAGMATGSQNSFMGQAMNVRNTSIADARNNFSTMMNDVVSQANQLRQGEFNKINQFTPTVRSSMPLKRSKKNKRRVLKSYAAQQNRTNKINKALGGVR